jgi:uncharacterized protein YjbJ (UPF0337 family)
MEIDPNKVKTEEDENEPALIDQVEDRVEAEMKRAEGRAQESVGQGMQDEELEREGRRLKEAGEQELEEQRQKE